MHTYTLEREQMISRPIEETLAFFAEAKNLEAITPLWLGFQILSPEPIVMVPGTLIEYQLRWHRRADPVQVGDPFVPLFDL